MTVVFVYDILCSLEYEFLRFCDCFICVGCSVPEDTGSGGQCQEPEEVAKQPGDRSS